MLRKGYKLKVGWNSGSLLENGVFLKKKCKIFNKNLEIKIKPLIFAPAFEMRAKVDWNNEEQVQFISTKKRVQALISLEKFIVQRVQDKLEIYIEKYTMKSLILAQDER